MDWLTTVIITIATEVVIPAAVWVATQIKDADLKGNQSVPTQIEQVEPAASPAEVEPDTVRMEDIIEP